ncbi:pyruvate dehydrogenase (acetyl-transferring) E1 component subunit alpha [Haloarchaeobius sp. HRN-SO-5]|uniref:pyruvate dehydrogenase (acetyl-transferring) E1 component subunit alpha n=1 Tax=Haloarchaeobius sp. HRN-SO-5 TaxID=3446118 RepID=UPI003EC14DAE
MSTITSTPPNRVQILTDEGHVRDGERVPDLTDDELVEMYRNLYLARRFDRRTVKLNRQGRIGSFPPLYGQEAAQVASAWALDGDDWVVPSYRDHAALMVHGLDPANILLYYMGREQGNRVPEDVNALPINGSVGSQLPHAVGLAWANALRDDPTSACVAYFGDGATSQGDVQEAFNFAGVFDTPNVFFCQNNQWAISVPRERQTASETIAQKANAYGFEGVQVDGMDPLAVYEVTKTAVEKAKNPDGGERRPTLVEAVLYRLGAHSTADDPSRYRDEEVTEKWRQKDPVPRFESFLRETGRLDDEQATAIQDEVEDRVAAAIRRAENTEPPDPRQLFEHTYEELPDHLEEQAELLAHLRETYGDEALTE